MKKKIVIEALAIGFAPCGLREFAARLCPRLVKFCPSDAELTFIVPPGKKECFGPADYIEAGMLKVHAMRNLPIVKADLFHALHQLCRVKNLPAATHKLMTVHDVNFVHTRTGRKYKASEARFLYRLQHADYLSFISQFAYDDVAAHFPFTHPARVIYNGVTAGHGEAVRPRALPAGVDKFLFHLSSLVPYKNPHLLVEMMDNLPERTLVMAGRCAASNLIEMAGKRKNVIMLGELTDGERMWLYQHCDAFLFPSKAEGFGLPPIEAMLQGKPVFLSTLTSLPEVGGNQAFYWPVLEPKVMAEVLEQKMLTPPKPDELRVQARRFNWDVAANEYVQYYCDILGISR